MLLSWGLLQVGNLIPSQNEMYFWKGLALLNINVLLPCPPPQTDETYTSYLPTNSMPLERLLGTRAHLELNLLSPYPDAELIVNYCIAFPRSARNALVFIYKGSAWISILGEFGCLLVYYDISLCISPRCTNPFDPYVYIHMTVQRHQRRIAIVTFQFMEQRTNLYLKEEVSIWEHMMVLRGLNKDLD